MLRARADLSLVYTQILDMRHLFVLLLLLTTLCARAEGDYKLELVDGKYVCQGSSECNTDNKKAFGSAALWLLEQQLDGKFPLL